MKRRYLLRQALLGIASAGLTQIGAGLNATAQSKGSERLHVLVTADFGSGNSKQRALGQQMAAVHQRERVDLVILGGDNIYAGPAWANGDLAGISETFEKPYRELIAAGVPFHAVLGNHDIITDNGNPQLAYKPFGMKGRWYSLRQGPVEFFMLDTNVNVPWQQQQTWLQGALAASRAPWKVVVGHHPIYSAGVYGDNPGLIAKLAPLFKRYGVQLYINGHDHHYERTKVIDGTTYLIVGCGGASLRPVLPNERTEQAFSTYGFAELLASSDRLEIKAINSQGQLIDQAVLRR